MQDLDLPSSSLPLQLLNGVPAGPDRECGVAAWGAPKRSFGGAPVIDNGTIAAQEEILSAELAISGSRSVVSGSDRDFVARPTLFVASVQFGSGSSETLILAKPCAGSGHQALHRLRLGRQMDRRAGRQQCLHLLGRMPAIGQLIEHAPFPIRGIQVDGGSEFPADFEHICQQRGLDLFVLLPKRRQLNGAVERAQRTWRYEFYACNELPRRISELQPLVDRFAHHFNHKRSHQALGDITPVQHLAQQSHLDTYRLI